LVDLAFNFYLLNTPPIYYLQNMALDQSERDKNLMVVAATEGYAGRHNIPTPAAFALLSKYGVTDAIRQNYNSLHTQSLDECVYFAEDMLKWKMG